MSVNILGKHDEISVKGTLDIVDAIYEFPFQNILESELKKEFETLLVSPGINQVVCLSDNELRENLYNYSKNCIFNSVDCRNYIYDEFNQKTSTLTKKIELSIFHLNVRSLNSKQRGLCQLIDLFHIDFDVIALSEIWTYNIEFYRNIFDGYILHCAR